MQLPKAAIFDCDNTLIPTWRLSYEACNHVWKAFGCDPMGLREFFHSACQPYIKFIRQRGIEATVADELIWSRYGEVFERPIIRECRNVRTVLDLLRFQEPAIPMAVISACNERITFNRLKDNGLHPYFRHIRGGYPVKIEAIKETCSWLGYLPEETWYVGDTPTDMEDAVNAGAIPIGLWSVKSPTLAALRNAGAKHVFRNYCQFQKEIWNHAVLQPSSSD